MKNNWLHHLFVLSALIPATILALFSIIGFFNLVIRIEVNDFPILTSILLGLFGYLGLLMLLFKVKKKIELKLNFIFLIFGILGFLSFTSLEGGKNAWEWILKIEEPDEWFIYVWPNIVALVYIGIIGKQLLKWNSKSIN